MMKKRIHKSFTITTLLALAISNLLVLNVNAISNEDMRNSYETPILVPKPQSIQYKSGKLNITNYVNIIGQEVADEEAVKTLKEFLNTHNILVNETVQANATTIYIGEADDNIAALADVKASMGVENAKTLKDEGYTFGAENNNKTGGTIVIEGKDGDGTFYGVQTFTQLALNDGNSLKINEVIIKDEPSMKTRGTIEGFYGTPWTHQDRINQIKFYGQKKMNTYIYAPKDDIYHREKWRDLYPGEELARMKSLVDVAKENKVDFVYAIAPGKDVKFDGQEGIDDFNALLNKCESLYDIGIRSFTICFDDVLNKEGVKQATFLNKFVTEFINVKGDVNPLITVPTEYDTVVMSDTGKDPNKYTSDFSKTLDSSVKVLWTGNSVVPEEITVENAQQVKRIYGDRVGIWFNYPTTDYLRVGNSTPQKLALGPVYGLEKGLEKEVDFIVMNPMEHAELSKISLSTGADFAWNTSEYDYNQSLDNSIELLYGDLAPYMKTFANHSTRLIGTYSFSTGRADAPEIRAIMDSFMKKVAREQDATTEIDALTAEFDKMILAADKLKEKLPKEQLKHCYLNLDKLKLLGQNDKLALELFLAKRDKDEAKISSLTTTLNNNLASLNEGMKLSEKTALAFITDILNYNPNPIADFNVSKTFIVPGEEINLINISSLSSKDMEWTMKGANVEYSKEENPNISYSKEGVYTISLKAKNTLGENVVIKEGIITVSKDASKELKNVSLGKDATASNYAYIYGPDKAVDGIVSTKWGALEAPHDLTVDLGDVRTISNIISLIQNQVVMERYLIQEIIVF